MGYYSSDSDSKFIMTFLAVLLVFAIFGVWKIGECLHWLFTHIAWVS